jgi:conjugal transfer pilus assembly protein TraW
MSARSRPVRVCFRCCLVAALAMAAGYGAAHDLGTLGPTYPIAEPHLLQMIEQRLREKERSGELAMIAEEARARGQRAVRQPAPVEGLRPTSHPRSFWFDPSIVLAQDVVGARGERLFAAGTRANPLNVVSLSRPLLFFDARDRRQVRQAKALLDRDGGRAMPVLTGGSYLDLMAAWRTPVYYDQQGLITRRLGITQVPAFVSQEGRMLRIDEIEVAP